MPFRILILWALVVGIWFLLVGHTLDNSPIFGYIRGGTADWLVTTEAWSGGDPYAPLNELAEQQLGWVGVLPTDPHPRPPSALLLLGPLALSPSNGIIVVLAIANALALSLFTIASVRWLSLPARAEFLIIPLAVVAPSLNSAVWGSHVPIIAACLGISLARERSAAGRATGIALAAGFKLFPFLLAFTGNKGRWRVVAWTASIFGLITLAGLLLPGVHLSDAVASLVNAPDSYATSDVNVSLNNLIPWTPASIALPLIGILLVVTTSRYMSVDGSTALGLVAMVLFAPYAWPEYMIIWFPALLYSWKLSTSSRLGVLMFLVVVALTKDGRLLAIAGLLLAGTLTISEMVARRTAAVATANPMTH